MVRVLDQIKRCDDGKTRERRLERVDKVVIHKIGASLGTTGPEIADAFRDTRKYKAGYYTGGQVGYHLVIRPDGIVDQCLYLTDTGAHAARFNLKSIGVAIVAEHEDFTEHPPTGEQWLSLVELCVIFRDMGMTIHGHTELGKGATSDPKKDCPGPMVPLDELRSEVALMRESKVLEKVREVGLVL